jgi:hypothetical protein
MIAYTVRARFTDRETADAWVAWLCDGHLAAVRTAGALEASVIMLGSEPPEAEARYLFASSDAFRDYERDHAPALRAEGAALFPPSRGITLERSVGAVVLRL